MRYLLALSALCVACGDDNNPGADTTDTTQDTAEPGDTSTAEVEVDTAEPDTDTNGPDTDTNGGDTALDSDTAETDTDTTPDTTPDTTTDTVEPETDTPNTPPSVRDVAIDPSPIPAGGPALHCDYTFEDADGDTDQSTIAWLDGDTVLGQGQAFTSYRPGVALTCRVTPRDATSSGSPATSAAVSTPPLPPLAAGLVHNCIVLDGAAWCWGDNEYGQLGAPEGTASTNTPLAVQGLDVGVTGIAAGVHFTCAIQNGALKCWGRNLIGQLGDGTNDNAFAPRQVIGLESGVTAVAAGDRHTCAIHEGTLKCWGGNANGALGDGTTNTQPNPKPVLGLSGTPTSFGLGLNHTCALDAGAVKCWGNNTDRQIGDGTNNPAITPKVVATLDTGVTALSVGLRHNCVIKDNNLFCWGYNNSGQVGDGTTTTVDAPRLIAADVSRVSAASAHTCAVFDGIGGAVLHCWGDNGRGRLGDGTTTSRPSPEPVATLTGPVLALVAGGFHTCAFHYSQLVCWGDNAIGQLGQGDNAISYPTPVVVPLP